jgi:hypothetical protein
VTGGGFLIAPEYDGPEWATPVSLADRMSTQRIMDEITPDWMSEADKNMQFIDGK